MFLSRGDRDLGVAFQTHPGRQAFISSGSTQLAPPSPSPTASTCPLSVSLFPPCRYLHHYRFFLTRYICVYVMFVLNSRHNWALRFSPLPFLLDQAALFSRSHKIFSNTRKNRLSPLCFLSSVRQGLQFKNPEHVKNNAHKPLLWFL